MPEARKRTRAVRKTLDAEVERVSGLIKPPMAPTREEPHLQREQQIARVEILMLKGVNSASAIGAMLLLDTQQVHRYMQAVTARWEIVGSQRNITVLRGQMVSRYDLLLQEAWVKLQNTQDDRNATVLIGTINNILSNMQTLQGLTPKVVERLVIMSEDRGDITRRLAKQDGLTKMAITLNTILKQHREREAIDVTPVQPEGA